MGVETKIEWCHHTFNTHWGCAVVSPECQRCYAETFSKRLGLKIWGQDADRRFFGDKHWAEPVKWNTAAVAAGERRRVFCASMSDVFEDRRDLDAVRARLFSLIVATPGLDWLLLTKRPENMIRFAPETWAKAWPSNIWAGTTVGIHSSMQRARDLIAVPAAVRFVSAEPLLSAIPDLSQVLGYDDSWDRFVGPCPHGRDPWTRCIEDECAEPPQVRGVEWVIVGSESGPGARAMNIAWAEELRAQCKAANVAFFTKQIANAHDKKGGDPKFWPPGEWPREFPRTTEPSQ